MMKAEKCPVFKLKHSRKSITSLCPPENKKLSLHKMVAELYPDEESLLEDDTTAEQQPWQPVTTDEMVIETSEDDHASIDQVTPTDIPNDDSSIFRPVINVIHPWKVIDYHLYLNCVEAGKNLDQRRNCMYLFDGFDCRPFLYREFFDGDSFGLIVGEEPVLLFAILPLADPGPSFNGVNYLLGFDFRADEFFVRRFTWIPADISDIWSIWADGRVVYRFTIPVICDILRHSTSGEGDRLDIQRLSASPMCEVPYTDDDPGMEMVIVIQCCQWLVDLADVLFEGQAYLEVDRFKQDLTSYMNEWRSVLQRASFRAWSALSNIISNAAHSHGHSKHQFIRDLYTLEYSSHRRSVAVTSWHAPSQDTCDRIRKDYFKQLREQAKEDVQKRFEELFSKPDDSLQKSPDKILSEMLARSAGIESLKSLALLFSQNLQSSSPSPRTRSSPADSNPTSLALYHPKSEVFGPPPPRRGGRGEPLCDGGQ
ncbi:hypothetical protein V8E54_001173 [Elaphomyces granulatus]